MNRKLLFLQFLILFLSPPSFAQNDITGKWEGMFLDRTTDLGRPRLVVEIFSFKDSLFKGLSHLYYRGNKYEHYKIEGRWLKKENMLVFMETETIAVDLGLYGNCPGTYFMLMNTVGKFQLLDGIWMPNVAGCTNNVKVWLQKETSQIVKKAVPPKNKPVIKQPVAKAKSLPKTDPVLKEEKKAEKKESVPIENKKPVKVPNPVLPAIITQRETDVQSLLEIEQAEKDSIRVDVYDNGEIDDDYVSVYEDAFPRINNKRISTRPLRFYVSLDKDSNPIVHLRLVAESLGTIPPCTALMVVTTKTKRYEVRLSSSFKSNATVELFLKN